MDWTPLASTAIGAALALVATVVAHSLSSRDRQRRESLADRRQTYLDFALAADAAYGGLRRIAEPGRHSDDLAAETRRAVSDSGVYAARERILVAASPKINAAGEQVLTRLSAMRHAIEEGATLNTTAYHDVYHPLADALWRLRAAARREFGNEPLKPEDLGKTSWDSQETCPFCASES